MVNYVTLDVELNGEVLFELCLNATEHSVSIMRVDSFDAFGESV
jgi:hypothetical protein